MYTWPRIEWEYDWNKQTNISARDLAQFQVNIDEAQQSLDIVPSFKATHIFSQKTDSRIANVRLSVSSLPEPTVSQNQFFTTFLHHFLSFLLHNSFRNF